MPELYWLAKWTLHHWSSYYWPAMQIVGQKHLCLALLLGDGCVTGKARDSVVAQCQIRHLPAALLEGAAAGTTAGSASLAVPCADCENLVLGSRSLTAEIDC